MNYKFHKRLIAIRILSKLACIEDTSPDYITRLDEVMKGLDELLPKDDSVNRGHTKLVDIVPVYEVDECPNCGKKEVQYSDAYEFCNECGYTFN